MPDSGPVTFQGLPCILRSQDMLKELYGRGEQGDQGEVTQQQRQRQQRLREQVKTLLEEPVAKLQEKYEDSHIHFEGVMEGLGEQLLKWQEVHGELRQMARVYRVLLREQRTVSGPDAERWEQRMQGSLEALALSEEGRKAQDEEWDEELDEEWEDEEWEEEEESEEEEEWEGVFTTHEVGLSEEGEAPAASRVQLEQQHQQRHQQPEQQQQHQQQQLRGKWEAPRLMDYVRVKEGGLCGGSSEEGMPPGTEGVVLGAASEGTRLKVRRELATAPVILAIPIPYSARTHDGTLCASSL